MNQSLKIISKNGIELVENKTYWYPSVRYCCHFSQTTVKNFKFHSKDMGHYQFVLEEFIFETEEEAKEKANIIRKLFGLPTLK